MCVERLALTPFSRGFISKKHPSRDEFFGQSCLEKQEKCQKVSHHMTFLPLKEACLPSHVL